MKKKGFTLIELLGIIIILAVIALLLVPAVLDMIEKARVSSAESGATLYVKNVELASAQNKITDAHLDGVYLINSDGNLCPEADGIECESPIAVEMKGNKPTSGTVVLESGKVKSSLANDFDTRTVINIGKYSMSYNINNEMRDNVICYLSTKTTEPLKAGTMYTCDTGDGLKKFYLLEVTKTRAIFMLDHNLGEIESISANNSEKRLKELTQNWTNIERKSIVLPDANLLTKIAGEHDGRSYSLPYDMPILPDWMHTNLPEQSWPRDSSMRWGYWTSTVADNGNRYYLFFNKFGGSTSANYCTNIGIRPSLDINKLQIAL